MVTKGKKISVEMVSGDDHKVKEFDKVLISVGRVPNSSDLGLENTDVKVDDKGFIITDECCETTNSNIYAIGDVAGGIQLAHKATKEAKIAAAKILNEDVLPLRDFLIPAVVFTDPEIAWVGLTEKEATSSNRSVSVHKFPWSASGRALTLNRTEGLTKIVSDPETGTQCVGCWNCWGSCGRFNFRSRFSYSSWANGYGSCGDDSSSPYII